MSFFKEDGDLALRPHVLVNSLLFRERRDGEAIMFKGKPLSESYAAVQAMITEFDARSRILENAHRVHNTAIERCAEASDIANVRVGAQSAAHSALADDAEEEGDKSQGGGGGGGAGGGCAFVSYNHGSFSPVRTNGPSH